MTTHIFFDPDMVDWNSFLTNQEGRGKYFSGTRYQRGYGLFQNIARFLLPIAKNIGTSLGQEGLTAGSKILGDVVQGRNVKDSLSEHSKRGVENLASKFQQCGKGKSKQIKLPTLRRRKRYIDQLSF